MGNLEAQFTFILLSRVVLAIAAGAQASFGGIEPCDDLVDIFTGCGNTFSSIVLSLALGIIPGPAWLWLALLNALLAVLIPGRIVLSLIKLARGVPDQ